MARIGALAGRGAGAPTVVKRLATPPTHVPDNHTYSPQPHPPTPTTYCEHAIKQCAIIVSGLIRLVPLVKLLRRVILGQQLGVVVVAINKVIILLRSHHVSAVLRVTACARSWLGSVCLCPGGGAFVQPLALLLSHRRGLCLSEWVLVLIGAHIK